MSTADRVAKIRLDAGRKGRWQARAAATGRTLSAFIRNSCDGAAAGLDSGALRSDLVRVRRLTNAIAAAARGHDPEAARRLAAEAEEVRTLIDRHLAAST